MITEIHATGIVYQSPEGHILVLKRNNATAEGGPWGIVGGKITPNQTALQAAIIKTKAEIGCDVQADAFKFYKTYHWHTEGVGITFEIFISLLAEGTPITLDAAGNVAFAWIKPYEAYRTPNLVDGMYAILEDLYGYTSKEQ